MKACARDEDGHLIGTFLEGSDLDISVADCKKMCENTFSCFGFNYSPDWDQGAGCYLIEQGYIISDPCDSDAEWAFYEKRMICFTLF